jgi:hypothetical protein
MTERAPMPDKLTVEDAMTQALLRGHAMALFRRDPQLGWPVATRTACGLRLFQYPDLTIAGAPLLGDCPTGRAIRKPRR